MADIFKILQQAQQVQSKMEQLQEELGRLTVTGSAGGGMVSVEADGKGNIKKVKIDPAAVNPADVEMLEDLVVVAITEAQKRAAEKAKDATQAEMGKLTGGLNLPFKLPF
ncbi:MAG: YbaB/EbfC family nucleoid-associated protein [Gemmatimonadetes bacterium]|jgi:nucleoid-associated protein EbfC|nr:YbaB/EbfC family nucleoid-associated protein [Gemmatimonadota bacterium]